MRTFYGIVGIDFEISGLMVVRGEGAEQRC